MNAPAPYDVVMSLAGHDAGKFFMVVGAEKERILLCDGRNRRLQNPKCKSPRHVRVAAVRSEEPSSDKDIRKTIALAAREAAAKEEILLGKR